jgi:acetoin:2,6-dichlorophenolindophenol oxidoreductase subunit beta
MAMMTYADAAKTTLAEEMRRDPLVWALGEDLGRGGVFGQYKGLVEEFGSDRDPAGGRDAVRRLRAVRHR